MYTKAMQIISSFDNSKSIWRIIFDQDPIPETQVCQNFPLSQILNCKTTTTKTTETN